MAPPSTAQVVKRRTRHGVVYALRFQAFGKRCYVTLGRAEDGWTRQGGEVELANVLADVRRGIWRPPHPEPTPEPTPDPTFHEFASEWFAARRAAWRPNTQADYEWRLSYHPRSTCCLRSRWRSATATGPQSG